jgi:UDP:flavonoid glycosyltransferase YjiC (YdhE family)
MYFGRPMIVLPLFWDQHDNAQRVHEAGFGVRLDPYRFADEQLLAWIDRLSADAELAGRLASVAGRLQAAPGTIQAAESIESLMRNRLPIPAST